MTTRRYAQGTTVHARQSKTEIEGLVTKHGASAFLSGWTEGKAFVSFEMGERRLRFVIKMPDEHSSSKKSYVNEVNRRWRALALAIKGKLESVANEIETFDEAFLSNIILDDGKTVYEHVGGNIRISYQSGRTPPLLPNYST